MAYKIQVTFNNDGKEETALLYESEALALLKFLYRNMKCDQTFPKFTAISVIDGNSPWEIGTAYIPGLVYSKKFWEKSNGREVADKWGIKEDARYYFFTYLEAQEIQKELLKNRYWRSGDYKHIEVGFDYADNILKNY